MNQSENVSRADNQQERLMQIGWIVGFVDGEGCFSIGFIKQPDRNEPTRIRRGYATGYQVAHEFAVVQGARSIGSLKKLKSFFGVGAIYINRRHDNHKEDLFRYTVTRREDLLNVIIPFFKENKMLTLKQTDFEKFAQCVGMMVNNKHLTSNGLKKIISIANLMNRKKQRKFN